MSSVAFMMYLSRIDNQTNACAPDIGLNNKTIRMHMTVHSINLLFDLSKSKQTYTINARIVCQTVDTGTLLSIPANNIAEMLDASTTIYSR